MRVARFIAIVQTTMDPLSDILMLMKPTEYGFRGLEAGGDWALDFAWAPGIRCFAIEQGQCWLRRTGDIEPALLVAGDVALLSGGEPVRLYSSEDIQALDAHTLFASVPPGEVAVVNDGGELRGMGGFFGLAGVGAAALLAALPPIIHVRSDTSRAALRSGVLRLMQELSAPQPGSALLASHLAQALLIEALRAHLAEARAGERGWLAALTQPAMRRALAAMHGDVTRRWTLAELAHEAGMSRSSFAAHFERVTGETPIASQSARRSVTRDVAGHQARPPTHRHKATPRASVKVLVHRCLERQFAREKPRARP